MEDQKHSIVNLFGKHRFSETDTAKYRLTVLVIQVVFILALAFILKEWVFPLWGAVKTGSLWDFIKQWKGGRSP